MLVQGIKFFRNGLAILALLAVPVSNASELKQETLNAWNEYLRTAKLRMHRGLDAGAPFLLTEQEAGRNLRVRHGEVLISPMGKSSPLKVPDGLIHDWIGAIFIPTVQINDVLGVVHDYNHYKDFYQPTIIESKLLGRTGEDYQFSMLGLKRVFFEKIVLEGQFDSLCSQLDERRWYCISSSNRIQEIKDYGQANQHELPPDEGHGFIWRIYSLTRFEERDGGVYIEVEAIALSRSISTSLGWFTEPVIERVSRASMFTILQCTANAVRSSAAYKRKFRGLR